MSDQTIVQLVGPDMTGKTEIAKELAKRLKVPYFKASSEHETYLSKQNLFIQQLRHADTRMVDFLRQTKHSAVFDRGYPCEWAYAEVMNRATDQAALAHIDLEYSKLDTHIVICYRRSYVGFVDDIDAKIDCAVLQRLEASYREFAAWTRCKVLFLDVDDEDLSREINDIMVWMGR